MSILCESSRGWQQLSKWISPYGLSQLWGDVGYCNWVTIRKRRKYDCFVQQLWLSVGSTWSGLCAGRSSVGGISQSTTTCAKMAFSEYIFPVGFLGMFPPQTLFSWLPVGLLWLITTEHSSADFRLGYHSWSLLSIKEHSEMREQNFSLFQFKLE